MNLLAVLAAGVINMIIGAIWYSPAVWGKVWMHEIGMKSDAKMAENMGPAYGITFVGALVSSYVLALIINYTGAATVADGIKIGLWLWLGFAVTLPLNDVIFGKKTHKLYALNAVYWLVVMIINSALLVSWK